MAVIRLTRPLGVLFATFCALAAQAAADPIDESARAAPEVEGASPTVGTGVVDAARPSEAQHAPGNPLWAVPLNALSSTRDRPLFSVSRRPPIVAVPTAAPPPKEEAVAPPPLERPLLALIGTIVSPTASVAIVQGSEADAISRLRVGQENDGWQVRGISLRSIVVEKGAQSVKLDMQRRNETSVESSSQNISAAADKASPPRQR